MTELLAISAVASHAGYAGHKHLVHVKKAHAEADPDTKANTTRPRLARKTGLQASWLLMLGKVAQLNSIAALPPPLPTETISFFEVPERFRTP